MGNDMATRVRVQGLAVDRDLYEALAEAALPGTGLTAESFFGALARIVAEFGPRNRQLLAKRERLQSAIDAWHRERADKPHDAAAYRGYLEEIGYLVPEGADFSITTSGVDPEIATVAGPQLVVPVTNPRYAINAANARWGSLYDALYGTDVIPEEPGSYNFV